MKGPCIPLRSITPSPSRRLWYGGALLLMVLTGCAAHAPTGAAPPGQATAAVYGPLPTTWQADITCPGCTEHWMTLTLFPDGTFRLRDRYVGSGQALRDEFFHDLGQWAVMFGDEHRLLLRGGSEAQRQFRLLPDGSLLMLDRAGREIRSIRDYVLQRQPTADAISGPMRLLGIYQAEGQEAWFSECLTGHRLSLALPMPPGIDRQYTEALRRQKPGFGILASLAGRFDDTPSAGAKTAPGLIVESFDRFWPGENCSRGAIAPAQPLLETSWQLVELSGEPVAADALAPPPTLRVRRGGRISGTTGCNRLQASYAQSGERLTVSRVLITRMSCPPSALALEQNWVAALRAVREHRVVGTHLELSDGQRVLARLVVSEMP